MPQWDCAGNQTRVQTNTGDWVVEYDAESRPTLFSGRRLNYQVDDSYVLDVAMLYDHKGRRVEKTIRTDGVLVERRRFVYMGYLPVAELRAVDDEEPVFSLVHSYMWDPAEPVATRPLALTCWEDGEWRHGNTDDPDITYSLNEYWGWGLYHFQTEMQTWEGMQSLTGRYYYIHDHNKNVKGLMDPAGELRGFYDYNAYGRMRYSSDGIARINHVGFSSEYCDRELDLVYYNYRHYNPTDGRWLSRDPIAESGGINLYAYIQNTPTNFIDILGQQGLGGPGCHFNSPTCGGSSNPNIMANNIHCANKKIVSKATAPVASSIINTLGIKDKQGRAMFERWMTGDGSPWYIDDAEWTRYMKNSLLLRDDLRLKFRQYSRSLPEGMHRIDPPSFYIALENGYRTGYQMLHGVNMEAGGFKMTGYAYIKNDNSNKKTTFCMQYTWNDKIDPNPDYRNDKIFNQILQTFCPADYSIHINWVSVAIDSIDSNGFSSGKGYPLELRVQY